jgi:hypothetical protein
MRTNVGTNGSRSVIIQRVAEILCEERATATNIESAEANVLIEFGNRLANSYSVSHLIVLYRIVLTGSTRHSDIGREFFERGPGKLEVPEVRQGC